jgi:hypothetical protein
LEGPANLPAPRSFTGLNEIFIQKLYTGHCTVAVGHVLNTIVNCGSNQRRLQVL